MGAMRSGAGSCEPEHARAAPATSSAVSAGTYASVILCGGLVLLVVRGRAGFGARRPALVSSAAVHPPVFAASRACWAAVAAAARAVVTASSARRWVSRAAPRVSTRAMRSARVFSRRRRLAYRWSWSSVVLLLSVRAGLIGAWVQHRQCGQRAVDRRAPRRQRRRQRPCPSRREPHQRDGRKHKFIRPPGVMMGEVRKDLELRHGLKLVGHDTGNGLGPYSQAETRRVEENRQDTAAAKRVSLQSVTPAEPETVRLERRVRAAASAAVDESDFLHHLQEQEVAVRPASAPASAPRWWG